MLNITKLALNNNRVTLSLLAIILIAGLQSYTKLPKAYDPGFIIRAAQIITYFPGASPSRVEELVTAQIEEVVKELPELDYVKSESRTGISIVTVNIKESYKILRPIWDSLRRKVEGVTSDLPDGVVGPIVNDEFGDVFGIVLALEGEGFSYIELKNISDNIKRELQRLPDVAKVEVYGEQDERIYIDYDNARLANLGMSASQLAQILSSRNIVMSGGSIRIGNERLELEPSGNYQSIDDLSKTIIQVPGSSQLIYLRDLGKVYRGYIEPPKSKVISGKNTALAIAVSMREGGNNIQLGEQVEGYINKFQETYPYGIELEFINFSPSEVKEKVDSFISNLAQAVIVVTIVMLFTLGLRTGFIVAALIPTTMLLTLSIMLGLDIGLDQISLAALIIALGMLVDNGIVMSESIMTQIESGKTPFNAAIESATELRIPLLTASLTTAAAFLPIYLAESNVGEFTASLFKVVSIALLSSWILSLTVIPLLCVQFMKVKKKELNLDSRLYSIYRSLLETLLRNKTLTLVSVTGLFFVTMAGFQFIPKIFFPPSDRTYFKMELELPLGTDISAMTDIVTKVNSFIDTNLKTTDTRLEGVTSYVSYVGTGGPRFVLSHNPKPSSPNYSIYIINTTSSDVIDSLINQLDTYTFKNFHDLDVTLRRIENGPSITYPVEVRLSGDNLDSIFSVAGKIKEKLNNIPGMKNISDDWGQQIKKLNINIIQERALRAGVSSQDIAISLQAGLSGQELTEYREGENIIPVILRSKISHLNAIGKLESLAIYSQATGQSVPLRQVADIDIEWQAANIYRRDGLKTVTVRGQLQEGFTAAEIYSQVTPWLESESTQWPIGLNYQLGGEAETSAKSNKSISDKLPIAGFIILFLLISQFNSIRKPVIILTTVPLGLIGVIVGLLLAQSFFGFMTLLGIISLAGIVINNAIVLLERIQIEIDEFKRIPYEAILSASQQRVRPILLTTLTTVLGLIPLYLGGGEMWEPLAIAIMGGLLFSTLLTLGIVPVLYAVFFRVK